jgi:phosphatidylglycerol---prolipoprotein diacylglyceryl transferase
MAVVFANRLTEIVTDERIQRNPLETIAIKRDTESKDTLTTAGHVPLVAYMFMKSDAAEADVRSYLEYKFKDYLGNQSEHFHSNPLQPMLYFSSKQDNGAIALKVPLTGIARHPAQLYESISCVLLFVFLFLIWRKHNGNPPEGRIFGLFMIILWGLRFFYEFLKENQVSFEDQLPLNMGQILSIPLFAAGVLILIRSFKKTTV